jgi:hypothetical protein
MITNNFKNKMLKAVRDSIYCFSYKVNGELLPGFIDIPSSSSAYLYSI